MTAISCHRIDFYFAARYFVKAESLVDWYPDCTSFQVARHRRLMLFRARDAPSD
jgi:hypothetical protein